MAPQLVASRYRVLRPIGEGGMGEVYLAVDETLKRQVALKAIRAEHRLNPEAKARFVREARVLSQLDHPCICRAFDYLETPENDWIVLELIEGRPLRDVMRGGLPLGRRLALALQIADVLVVTHAAGVVHRDLKPGNVMVTASGAIKVLDFGLSATLPDAHAPAGPHAPVDELAPDEASLAETRAPSPGLARGSRAIDVSAFTSRAGSIKGTVAYMSPEQARGEWVTPASDMYSFGLLLQELFSGEAPYGDLKDSLEMLARAQRGESRAPTGVPASMRTLVLELKALVPAQRPTALAVAERLRRLIERPQRIRRTAAAAALIVLAIGGTVRYTVDLARERTIAVAARQDADRRRTQAESLISFMVGDLRTKLTAVGRLEILDDVGKQAVSYFASVPAAELTDEELYRRSQVMHQLGQVRHARADLEGALRAFEDSLSQAEAVVRRNPDNAVWQLGLGTSHFYVGDLKMRTGDLTAALSHFLAYKGIAERLVARDPGNLDFKLEQAYGHSNVAAIYQRQGNLPGAREELLRVAASLAELAVSRPDDRTLQSSRANNFNRLGIVQDALGDLPAAAASFERELEVHEALVARNPTDARLRRRRQVSLIYLGVILRARGHVDAVRYLDRAVEEAQALVSLDSTNADWQRDLGVGLLHRARIDLDRRQGRQAIARLSAALGRLEPLAGRPRAPEEAVRDVSKVRLALAEAHLAAGDLAAATRHADAALASLEALARTHPADPETLRDLSIADNVSGLIWNARRDVARARAAWSRSRSRLEPLVTASRDRNLLEPWARVLLYLGRMTDARTAHERLVSIGFAEPGYLGLWQQSAGTSP